MAVKKEKTSGSYTLRITENAYQHLDDIAEYLAYIKHQPLNAIKVIDAIFQLFEQIANNPYQFKECEELKTTDKIYRIVSCKNWLIIYKIAKNKVIILGVIYGKRHPKKIKKLRKVK
jgi:plasmid stabilization system protein ParE